MSLYVILYAGDDPLGFVVSDLADGTHSGFVTVTDTTGAVHKYTFTFKIQGCKQLRIKFIMAMHV